jgi:hypothetical protein
MIRQASNACKPSTRQRPRSYGKKRPGTPSGFYWRRGVPDMRSKRRWIYSDAMFAAAGKVARSSALAVSAWTLALAICVGSPSGANAAEAEAKSLLKAMSDYLAAQNAISNRFDDEKRQCANSAARRHPRNSPPSTARSTITLIRNAISSAGKSTSRDAQLP